MAVKPCPLRNLCTPKLQKEKEEGEYPSRKKHRNCVRRIDEDYYVMMDSKRKYTADEVLTKIKDDGDFDRLRLKIVRRLKDDGELRSSIISMVKQSAALNRPGAESMKPRQLSDAIHQEIGNNLTNQISDAVWKVLRSGDQITGEITETVESVCSVLSNPNINGDGGSSSRSVSMSISEARHGNRALAASVGEIHGKKFEGEPSEPSGFHVHNQNGYSTHSRVNQTEERTRTSDSCNGSVKVVEEKVMTVNDLTPDGSLYRLTGAITVVQSDDNVDDDPEVPPGFGF